MKIKVSWEKLSSKYRITSVDIFDNYGRIIGEHRDKKKVYSVAKDLRSNKISIGEAYIRLKN